MVISQDSWAAISNRTYIWNYVTNFGNYLQPFPNWYVDTVGPPAPLSEGGYCTEHCSPPRYVLGPNIQYFAAHGVRGMLEEGETARTPILHLQRHRVSSPDWCNLGRLLHLPRGGHGRAERLRHGAHATGPEPQVREPTVPS